MDAISTPTVRALEHLHPVRYLPYSQVNAIQALTIRDAMFFLWERMKLVVEPTGALAYAAVLENKLPAGRRRIGIIISGGNVDLREAAALMGV